MIVLDTSVLSELMRPVPNVQVLAWVDDQPASELAITAINVAEILYGIGRLANGKREQGFQAHAMAIFEEDFADNILPFNAKAAVHYAALMATSEAAGWPTSMADGQIAAICQLYRTSIATRNVRDFKHFNLPILNPWDA
ncbi:MAG: type II toxin-antitoxin system VapC family toxin [Burkholderiaceae bacterium]